MIVVPVLTGTELAERKRTAMEAEARLCRIGCLEAMPIDLRTLTRSQRLDAMSQTRMVLSADAEKSWLIVDLHRPHDLVMPLHCKLILMSLHSQTCSFRARRQ